MDITYTARACLDNNRIVLTLLERRSEFSLWDIQPTDTGSKSHTASVVFPIPLPYSSYVNKRAGVEAFSAFLSYIDTHK